MDLELLAQYAATKKSWDRFQYNKERDWGLTGIDIGQHDLNLLLNGLQPRKLITVGARSGHGKTAIITPIVKASERADDVHPEYIIFTWEMGGDLIVDRYISHETGLTYGMLSQGAKLLNDAQIQYIKEAYVKAKNLPITYQEASTDFEHVKKIFLQFCERCEQKSKQTGKKIQPIGIIDYIGMAKFENTGLRTYAIGDFMNGCKKLANDTNGSFVVLAQLLRAADDKALPERNDLKDSSDIENASDALILLHRPEYNGITEFPNGLDATNKAMLRVLKNRMGAVGDIIINCDIKYNRFYSLNHTWDFDYWSLYKNPDFWMSHFDLKQ